MRLYTRREAAEFLRIGRSTLDAWTARGWIKTVRLGRRVLYTEEELERVIREGIPPRSGKGNSDA